VLTGTVAEASLTASIARGLRAPAIDLARRTDLGALGAVLSRARLLVCNDTAVSHVADALKVPSVVISTGDNPGRWAPVDRDRHRVLCRPKGISAGEVIEHAEDLLRRSSACVERIPIGPAKSSAMDFDSPELNLTKETVNR
jgi:ADP-heptose:LPS heptosyltransferase